MTILLLDFFLVSLELDIHMEFFQHLKYPKRIYLQFPGANATWWQWQFVRMPFCDWLTLWLWQCSFQCGTKPEEMQQNSIWLLTQASSFYMRHQNEIGDEFGSTLSSHSYPEWSDQNTQSCSIPKLTRFIFASHSFFHRGSVGSLWKLTPVVVISRVTSCSFSYQYKLVTSLESHKRYGGSNLHVLHPLVISNMCHRTNIGWNSQDTADIEYICILEIAPETK